MKSVAYEMKARKNTDSAPQPTSEQAPAIYGYATYSYKKGAFIYRVEGAIYDLRETGCSIRGTTPQPVGGRIRVSLSLNDQRPPICVHGARVSWLSGESFGLKFPELKPGDLARLREYTNAQCKPG